MGNCGSSSQADGPANQGPPANKVPSAATAPSKFVDPAAQQKGVDSSEVEALFHDKKSLPRGSENNKAGVGSSRLAPESSAGGEKSESGVLNLDAQQTEKATTAQDESTTKKDESGKASIPADEALSMVSQLIAKFAEGRNDGKTPVLCLKRSLGFVAEDLNASCVSIHILSPAYDYGMLLAMVGKAGEAVDDGIGFQMFSKHSNFAAQKLLSSNAKSLSWRSGDGQPAPQDWQVLIDSSGVKLLVASPIIVSNVKIAVLTLGFQHELGWFDNPAWPNMMQFIGSSLASSIKNSSMPKYLTLVHDMRESPDLDSLLHQTVAHFRDVLGHQNNQHVWYRVALCSQIGSSATAAMIFDDVSQMPAAHMRGGGGSTAGGNSISKSECGRMIQDLISAGGITRTPITLSSTILKVCIQHKQQVMVPDVQKLLNQSGCVSVDVFNNRLFKPPTSVLIFPLRVRQNIFGAVYCMSSVKSDFSDVAMRIRELADLTSPHMMHVLKGSLQEEYDAMREASAKHDPRRPGSGFSRDPSLNGHGANASGKGSGGDYQVGSGIGLGSMGGSAIGIGGAGSGSFVMAQSRSSTGALVSGLTEKLNEKRILSSMDFTQENNLRDLQIKGLLGEGGFAKVFRGLWQGIVVGVKVVCVDGKNTKMDMKNAHEIAILSTISHPNIIQAYKCMTDIPVSELINQCMRKANTQVLSNSAYQYLVNNQDKVCHIEVLEYCDQGNLATAIQNQVFITEASDGTKAVAMPGLLTTLLEIASAMAELHSMGVVHCDLKPPNVLLKSSNLDFKGYSAKVSDFGLSRVEDDESTESFPFNSCGTAAYVAPEALVNSKKVNSSVDVYAYGILMWEMYTAQRPYSSMSQKEVVEEVVLRGLRPKFPDGTPAEYAQLARSCWSKTPSSRPRFSEVIQTLNQILTAWTPVTGPMTRVNSGRAGLQQRAANSEEAMSAGSPWRTVSGSGSPMSSAKTRHGKPNERSSGGQGPGPGQEAPQNYNRAINKGALGLLEMQQRK